MTSLMMTRRILLAVTLLSLAYPAFANAADAEPAAWPQFRGPSASGIAIGKPPPIEFDVEKGKNVRWKTEVPGLGLSSPVIWGDRLFLTTAVSDDGGQPLKPGLYGDPTSANDRGKLSWKVLCFDTRAGKQLWERTARHAMPQIKRHPKSSHANPSCCTDGKRVLAFFGSEGLYCYDMEGKPLWEKSFGLLDSGAYMEPAAQWGFASSPVLFEGKVVLLADVQEAQKKSFLAVFDAADGKEIWKTERHDLPTWGTPTVYREPGTGGRTLVLVNGCREAAGYDFATGKRLWTIGNGGDVPVPTPVIAHGLVFLTSAHGKQSPIYAVKAASAEGDLNAKAGVDSPHVAWQIRTGGNYMQTPIVVDDYLYCCRDNGVMTCFEARTGKLMYRERLQGQGFTASAVAAGDRIYFTAENGQINVVQA